MTDVHQPDPPMPDPTARLRTLSPADAAALDALASDPARPATHDPRPQPGRAARVAGWLALLSVESRLDGGGQADTAAPGDLAARTLARVQAARQQARFNQQIAALRFGGEPRGFGFQWRELSTVAAVVLIGLSLLWPLLDQSRAQARRIACAGNLATAGMGLSAYAADAAGVLPRRLAHPGDDWWAVGSQPNADGSVRSNTAHLYLLIRTGYARPSALACPDNPDALRHARPDAHDFPRPAAVSFSYQNQFTPQVARLERLGGTAHSAGMPILADRNPLFVIHVSGLRVDRTKPIDAASPHHRRVGPGQNVLTATGSVRFITTPVVARPTAPADNIWLLGARTEYEGTESPHSPQDDAFLVP